jgi:hypothetical protein
MGFSVLVFILLELLSRLSRNWQTVVTIILVLLQVLPTDQTDKLTLAIIMIPSTEARLDILLISQILPVSHFTLSPKNELTPSPCPPEIECFFTNKHDEYTTPGTKSIFHIFGASASPNSTILNIFFEYLLPFTSKS